jgi:predicted DNA-binding transcriptional regulator AlpA
MKTHRFTLILGDVAELSDQLANAVFEAGCDDAVLGSRKGVVFLSFDREGRNLLDAIRSALHDIKKTGFEVSRIEPDNFVTMADIARRINQSRASVTKYVKERSRKFPSPVSGVTTNSPIWRWSDVAFWLAAEKKIEQNVAEEAAIVSQVNSLLEAKAAQRGVIASRGKTKQKQTAYGPSEILSELKGVLN